MKKNSKKYLFALCTIGITPGLAASETNWFLEKFTARNVKIMTTYLPIESILNMCIVSKHDLNNSEGYDLFKIDLRF